MRILKVRNFVIYFLVIFIAIVAFLYFVTFSSKLVLDGKTFSVEVSDTKELLEKGLSGHAPISKSSGMLFVFQKPGNYGFWMKDMLFPLDIIWMDSRWRVVHIEEAVSPKSYPSVFYPGVDSLYAMEVNAGVVNSLGVKIGDIAKYYGK